MATPDVQTWYHQTWQRAAQMARDATMPGTPEREAAEREHDAELAAFRVWPLTRYGEGSGSERSKGRRQNNHPQFQFGNKGLLCGPKIKEWPFASFQALNCRLRGKSDNWLWRRGRPT
jgi:hypothetical protein